MHTLLDFITHAYGIEYALALLFVAGYIVLSMILHPKPASRMAKFAQEDAGFIREAGVAGNVTLMGRAATGLALLGAYVVSLPMLFLYGLGQMAFRGGSSVVSYGWSPVEAYFTGRRSRRKKRKDTAKGDSK